MSRGREQFDLIPNTATWEERVELYEDETGEPFDLTLDLNDIVVSLRNSYTGQVEFSKDLATGEVFLIDAAGGAFGWKFPVSTMASLYPKTYEIGVQLHLVDEVNQMILGRVSVVRGL